MKQEELVAICASLQLQDGVVLKPLEQWVDKVTAFSSQYGSTRGSWAAENIQGPPTTYPAYGDIASAWAPLQRAGGAEFVEFRTARKSRLTGISIYETSAPGALVRASVRIDGAWHTLWQGVAEARERISRILKVPFEPLDAEIDEFRLDFDTSTWCSEWYEIDCIKIEGLVPAVDEAERRPPTAGSVPGDLLKLLETGSGDVIFVTSTGVEMRAHRCIVNARCPALLLSQTSAGAYAVVEDSETLRILLKYIYADHAEIPATFSVPVFLSASRLGLVRLADAAAEKLLASLRPTNVVAVLKVVDAFPRLRKICLEYAARALKPITENGANAQTLTSLSVAQLADLVCAVARIPLADQQKP